MMIDAGRAQPVVGGTVHDQVVLRVYKKTN